jgi:aldehyde dehydrogenase (NAD+)
MSDLFVELKTPNGKTYQQPRGLFINNEFVKSKSGETLSSINPRYGVRHVSGVLSLR